MRGKCIVIGATDSILFTAHGVDKIAVFTPHRVPVSTTHRPAPSDINHKLTVGQLDGKLISKDVQPDAVAPARRHVDAKLATTPVSKVRACGRNGRHVEPGKTLSVLVPRAPVNIGYFTDQEPREIEKMRRLLHHLAAGFVLFPPPSGGGVESSQYPDSSCAGLAANRPRTSSTISR